MRKLRTYERKNADDDVDGKASGGVGDEVGYGAEEDNNGGDGSGEKHLQAQDSVDFADESPAELGALKQHGVELVGVVLSPSRLNVTFVRHVCDHKMGDVGGYEAIWPGSGFCLGGQEVREGEGKCIEDGRSV